jgi:hypothetical protein
MGRPRTNPQFEQGYDEVIPPPPGMNRSNNPGLIENEYGDYQFRDATEQYGSIIKDLTDTDKILMDFELSIQGKFINEEGKIMSRPNIVPYIPNENTAREFVDLVRSFVNRHNDFSYYSENEINDYIQGANVIISRWLMFQSSEVPLRYRQKIAFQGMALINASLHKASGGKMLVWTKGTFREGLNISADPQQKKRGLLSYVFPWAK